LNNAYAGGAAPASHVTRTSGVTSGAELTVTASPESHWHEKLSKKGLPSEPTIESASKSAVPELALEATCDVPATVTPPLALTTETEHGRE
jgi:hypothetical protein